MNEAPATGTWMQPNPTKNMDPPYLGLYLVMWSLSFMLFSFLHDIWYVLRKYGKTNISFSKHGTQESALYWLRPLDHQMHYCVFYTTWQWISKVSDMRSCPVLPRDAINWTGDLVHEKKVPFYKHLPLSNAVSVQLDLELCSISWQVPRWCRTFMQTQRVAKKETVHYRIFLKKIWKFKMKLNWKFVSSTLAKWQV